MRKYYSNNLFLKGFRKKLRNNSTSAEAALWNLLKSKKIDGRKFRRQHGFGFFILDFYCSSEKLIIELDGDLHGEYYKIEEDKKRDEILKNLGYKTIRFENKEVFQNPDYVIEEIKKRFNKLANHLPPDRNVRGTPPLPKEEKRNQTSTNLPDKEKY